MTSHARLAVASGLIATGFLTLAPTVAAAFATPSSGSSGSEGGSAGSSGTSAGASSGTSSGGTGTSTGSGSATGGSTGSSSGTTGSEGAASSGSSQSSGSTSATGGGSSPSGSNSPSATPPNLFGGMVGQFTHIVQHFTDALTQPPSPTGSGSGAKNNSKNPAAVTTGTASKPDSSSSSGGQTTTAPAPTGAADTVQSSPASDTSTPTKSPLAQLPLTVAQVPLTALDLVKNTLPVVVDAVPIPGLAALPAFADALIINPLQDTVRGLATAASDLPFLQYIPGTIGPQPTTSGRTPMTSVPPPSAPKVFAAGTGPLPRDVTPALPAAPGKPTAPADSRHVFAADDHIVAAPDFRPGYPDYLRAAGLSEVAAVAVPGFAGIVTLTAAGGMVGYRQARAHTLAPTRATRFVD